MEMKTALQVFNVFLSESILRMLLKLKELYETKLFLSALPITMKTGWDLFLGKEK